MIVCGKGFSSTDIAITEDIIADNQQISRAQLSQQVCKALNWCSDNGRLKDMSCRVALLRMHHQGVINLPERAFREVRRRTRPMSCFNNEQSIERILYAVLNHLNEQWGKKPLKEFTQKD